MGKNPCCVNERVNRGAWTAMEDKTLTDYIKKHGEGRWRTLSKHAGLKRCGKSCRLRWLNYLRPDIKRGNISDDEEELIIRLHRLLGNRWSLIAGRLPGRTDNEIKNHWNAHLSKKIQDHQLHRHQHTERKMTTKPSIVAEPVEPNTPSPNVAIRTKAVKCTARVFVNLQPPPLKLPPLSLAPPSSDIQVTDPVPGTLVNVNNGNFVLPEGLMLEDPLLDFSTLDFSMMGESNFSEFLNSQQMLDICCEFNEGTSNEGERFSQPLSLEEPTLFPDETMEDWRRISYVRS